MSRMYLSTVRGLARRRSLHSRMNVTHTADKHHTLPSGRLERRADFPARTEDFLVFDAGTTPTVRTNQHAICALHGVQILCTNARAMGVSVCALHSDAGRSDPLADAPLTLSNESS